jgi:YegS/Rv2252/BmrU family lipid kinase
LRPESFPFLDSETRDIFHMGKTAVILNGTASSAAGVTDLMARLARRHECDLHIPASSPNLAALVKSLAQHGVPRIIAAGGDGTISGVVNALLPEFPEVEVAVIPLGTGNDLARALDIPFGDLEMAFQLAATRPATPMDVVEVHHGDDTFFVNAATGGFGGEVTATLTRAEKQIWGPFAYWLTAMARLSELHAFDLDLTLDGERTQQRVYGFVAANGRYVGGGFPMAGQALLDDGLLDVTIVPELPAMELLTAGLGFMLGSPSGESGALVTRRARRLEMHASPQMAISLDGEATQVFDAVLEVAPGALRIVAGDSPAAFVPTDSTVAS